MMTAPCPGTRQPKQTDAGPLLPEIRSFRLHLAAEGKSAKTIRTYTEAAAWFAAAHLLRRAGKTAWAQADKRDVQQWMGLAAGPLQRLLRQQPVPGAAAVLQVARR
jgi:hypothetical protein